MSDANKKINNVSTQKDTEEKGSVGLEEALNGLEPDEQETADDFEIIEINFDDEADEMEYADEESDETEDAQEEEQEHQEKEDSKNDSEEKSGDDSENDSEEDSEDEAAASENGEDEDIVFLYDDSEENPNFDKEAEEEKEYQKALKKAKIWKVVRIVAASTAGVILAAYLGLAYFFNSHFYFNTEINGNDLGMKSVEAVEQFMAGQVDGYSLKLEGNDNTTENIVGKDISLKYQKSDGLKKALKEQNPFLWPKAFFEEESLEIPIGVQYDKAALDAVIAGLNCVTNPEPILSVSAVPEFDGNQFAVKKEVLGNQVNVETFTAAVEEHLNGFIDTMNMQESGSYVVPKFLSDSPEVQAACDTANKYLVASITYDFNPYTEVVDKTVISGWLATDENMQVTFQTEKVREYVAGLAAKYDTSGKPRSFVTASGNTVEVKNGIYGWRINQEEEYNKLVANIQAGETVTREPEYSRKAVSHEGNDFGNTYAEVDLTQQKMWFFQNGQLMMESPIVTGKPSAGDATPQGTYTVTYTQRRAVLRGPKQPDGSYEWESPVEYWMPFNGGIGFHDASWQAAYGGDRYLTHGSHGCINMPLDKAKQLFGYLQAGTPVICHY